MIRTPNLLKRATVFVIAFCVFYGLIFLSNDILEEKTYFSIYLAIAIVFSMMAASKFWAAAAIFGVSSIIGNIVHYLIIQSQGRYVNGVGGVVFGAYIFGGFLAALICQLIIKRRKRK